VIERAQEIAAVCEQHGTTLPAAAIAFPLAHAAVVTVCVGARSPQQVERNVALYRETVGSELWADLKAHGLLREDAPPF
jgi:D-threo-aldose 1-dehydrogenase